MRATRSESTGLKVYAGRVCRNKLPQIWHAKIHRSWTRETPQIGLAQLGFQRPQCRKAVGEHGIRAEIHFGDIPQMTSKFEEFVPSSHHQWSYIPFAVIRWHDFGDRPSSGRPFAQILRHSDTPLLSFSPRRRFPRPTPGWVAGGNEAGEEAIPGCPVGCRPAIP